MQHLVTKTSVNFTQIHSLRLGGKTSWWRLKNQELSSIPLPANTTASQVILQLSLKKKKKAKQGQSDYLPVPSEAVRINEFIIVKY